MTARRMSDVMLNYELRLFYLSLSLFLVFHRTVMGLVECRKAQSEKFDGL